MPPNTLSFVHHTRSERDMDEQARKLVRSQAMIDFRRKQKEERMKKSSSSKHRAQGPTSRKGDAEAGIPSETASSATPNPAPKPAPKPTILKFSINEPRNPEAEIASLSSISIWG
ncbi:hypothetical protein K432DRAFT_390515 [Lepidopterella palustris CBS 459.81]|uniref:Uncharacterized protein n=1 Tax=Lepidopterella palustris CBS 459.81 TaxID=1314670 RepID=A0A8E2EG90_9PEZI|nr:hypothetical protein K432DRAFT_390515 [Lepidopterella palustris CBS 459.81]